MPKDEDKAEEKFELEKVILKADEVLKKEKATLKER